VDRSLLAVFPVPVNPNLTGRPSSLACKSAEGTLRGSHATQLCEFVSADYVGALFWWTPPRSCRCDIVALEGATANAYFALALDERRATVSRELSTGRVASGDRSRDGRGLHARGTWHSSKTGRNRHPVRSRGRLRLPSCWTFGGAYSQHGATTTLDGCFSGHFCTS